MNMKFCLNIAILSLLLNGAGAPVMAETVSQKQAKDMAQKFFDQAYHETTAPVSLVYNGKKLTTDRLFTPFYVYNQPRGGFVIISAENKAFPILGYSLKSSFNPDDISKSEMAWLQSYARDIELIRYDPREPEEAIKAWQNYPQYLVNLLNSHYNATDPDISLSEAYAGIDMLLYTPDDSRDGEFSIVYTPEQWRDMIAEQVDKAGSVAIGYVDDKKVLHPAVAHGRKGDYFRMALDRPNDWLMRLMPAEFLGERQVALLSKPRYIPEPEIEDTPFEFYDSFIAEQTASAERAQEEMQRELKEPIVRGAAAGHFDVLLPENARLAMIYNLNGSYIGRATYSGQPVAHINIEAEPAGFYFAIIYGESGRPYGIKLYR